MKKVFVLFIIFTLSTLAAAVAGEPQVFVSDGSGHARLLGKTNTSATKAVAATKASAAQPARVTPQAAAPAVVPVTSPQYVEAVQVQGPGPGAPIYTEYNGYSYRPRRVAEPPQIWPAAGGYAGASGYSGYGGGYGGGYYYPTVPSRSTGSVKWDIKNSGFFETGRYRHFGYTAYPPVRQYYTREYCTSIGVGGRVTINSGLSHRHW